MRELEWLRRVLGEHLADEARIPRVVLDEEDRFAQGLGFHFALGSVTTVSQKRSIDCTTVMNFSRSTGLVT